MWEVAGMYTCIDEFEETQGTPSASIKIVQLRAQNSIPRVQQISIVKNFYTFVADASLASRNCILVQ
jgi:hypothetical protein